ncbi:peptidoglycan-N-acetylmuramic acid deacetylase [Evansella caseinilytica]|uniref:Peptidoglycan-N-acetylmuramic acid deacetylase n=1 Tax=Evansella caseinilytica TaxID=1503961 RepID=A0A1H3H301_9BACI|nr:delta-lactam-biosynthetic de-N-acetylase [Evansella caseinilytica]SDY09605.1 peptidoglycan-N-acetylmuramic acid deacetylase [Evansella caseinilytica]
MKKSWLLLAALFVTLFAVSSSVIGAESNVEYHWSFKPSKNHEPASTEPLYAQLLQKYNGIYRGDITKKEVFLTFDNGYENGYTEKILDALKEKQVPATFFVTGHYLQSAPELIKRMVNEGHNVGNHSFHHPSLPAVDDERLKRELVSLEELYEEITGRKDMRFLRPPRGTFSERTLARSAELGYINVFWSLAYKDWETANQKGWKHAYNAVMKRIHPGAIVLLHSVSSDNAEALPKIIDDLRADGYTFKSLDELLIENGLLPQGYGEG